MRVLIIGEWNASKEQLCEIEELGHEVIWLPQEREPLPVPYECIDGVICNGLFLYHPHRTVYVAEIYPTDKCRI